MDIHHSTIQRLAFVKYLFSLAVEQSRAPEIMAAASLLTFHDSIELFLQISAEHLNVGSKQPNFMDYWDLIPDKLPVSEFPQKEAMRRLNKARVALKHHGTLPSKLDIEAFRAATASFFEESTELVFGIEFINISLIEYVSPEKSRNHLKKAEELCRDALYEDATIEIALAFEKMIVDYESSKKELGLGSPFFFGKDMTFLSSFHLGISRHELSGVAKFIDNVNESIEAMQRAIKILALGLDYKKYSKFKLLLPHVYRMMSGDYTVHKSAMGRSPLLDKEYIEFCIGYVVECAIKLNEFNYSLKER
jgi:hypothetical protein